MNVVHDTNTLPHHVDTDILPDLVVNSGNTAGKSTSILHDRSIIPPIRETPPEHLFDGATTEEEFNAVDALLSLGTVRTNSNEDNDDNSSLMLIGGSSRFVNVNPVPIQLDRTTVDGAIAQIVEDEQNSVPEINYRKDQSELHDGCANSGEQTVEVPPITDKQKEENNEPDPINNYDDETELTKKGFVKLTTHGIKKKSSTAG